MILKFKSLYALVLGMKESVVYKLKTSFDFSFEIFEFLFSIAFWSALSKSGVVNYKPEQFLLYYFAVAFINRFVTYPRLLSRLFRNGGVQKQLVLPYHFSFDNLFYNWGRKVYTTVIFILLFIPIHLFFKIRIFNFLMLFVYAVFSSLLTYLFDFLIIINYAIYPNTEFIDELYETFWYFLSGTLIPIFLLPHNFIAILRIFPFYYMSFAGAKQFVFGFNLTDLLVLLIWDIIMLIVDEFLFYRMTRIAESRETHFN